MESHSNRTAHEQNQCKPQTFECYVCKTIVATAKDLRAHIKKHVVYELWIDPVNVYLSNWCPDKSREILQNQPLVLVENLNIKNINPNFSVHLNRLDDVGTEPIINETKHTPSIIIEHNAEKIKIENRTIAGMEPLTSVIDDDCDIELKYSELSDQQQIYDKNENKQPTLLNPTLTSDCMDIPIVEQLPDTTTIYVDDCDEVIDVSSDSEVDDILELFHCYFCDETLRSLDVLGVHVKTCSLRP